MKMKVKNWSFIENNRKNHISAGQLCICMTQGHIIGFSRVLQI